MSSRQIDEEDELEGYDVICLTITYGNEVVWRQNFEFAAPQGWRTAMKESESTLATLRHEYAKSKKTKVQVIAVNPLDIGEKLVLSLPVNEARKLTEKWVAQGESCEYRELIYWLKRLGLNESIY